MLAFQFAYGVSLAACVLVGNSIGAGDVKTAKRYSKLIMLFGIVFLTVILSTCFAFRYEIARFYTKVPETVLLFGSNLQWMLIMVFIDGIQNI